MPKITVNGVELFYLDTGNIHSGRAVLALHSLGADYRLWSKQIEFLAPHARIIAPDSRGHGRSGWSGSITPDGWAADIEAILDQTGVDVVDLIGISLGGIQAMICAQRHPDRFGAIVLADTFSHLPENIARKKLEGSAGVARRLGMKLYAEHYVSETLTTVVDEQQVVDLRSAIAGMSLEAYAASARTCFEADVRESLSAIRAPTLVLWGKRDEKTPRTLSEELVERIPHSEFKTVPSAGHLSNLDNPAAFNSLVAGFLDLPTGGTRERESPDESVGATSGRDA